jgi:hypothetical protein
MSEGPYMSRCRVGQEDDGERGNLPGVFNRKLEFQIRPASLWGLGMSYVASIK